MGYSKRKYFGVWGTQTHTHTHHWQLTMTSSAPQPKRFNHTHTLAHTFKCFFAPVAFFNDFNMGLPIFFILGMVLNLAHSMELQGRFISSQV